MSLLEPNLIVDFELENELIFIRIANHSDAEIQAYRIRFNRIIFGLTNAKEDRINELSIFKTSGYFAPRKEIRIVINHIDAFFRLNKTPNYRIRIDFRDMAGKNFSKSIIHDLNIYRDLPQIYNSNSSRNSSLDNIL